MERGERSMGFSKRSQVEQMVASQQPEEQYQAVGI